jgi:N-acetylglucosaminyl-diphospho-decaprenol L-rhamnosyltransferase
VDVEVILMVYRGQRVLGEFLDAVGTSMPVLLIDNSYHEEDLSDLLAAYPNVRRVDSGGNIGFSAAANLGARMSTATYLVFMNPDTQPSIKAISELVDYLKANPTVGACGAAGKGTAGGGAQPTARRILAHTIGLHKRSPLSGIYFQRLEDRPVDVEWVAGSCLAIRAEVFRDIGGFDPDYFIYMSDFDLGLRLLKAGHRQVVLGHVVVPHDDGGSSDVPALATWERRGRAWVRFLRRTRPLPGALGLTMILAAGYAVRTVLYILTGRRLRAREVATYLRAIAAEWLRPTSSTPPLS